MADLEEFNLEAYRIMAEILVTVRRIMQRGLEKASGKTWYLDGCPPGLFERLIARKETEVAIDRFDRGYQELLSFATMDDLAEVIEYNQELARLLTNIAPEGASMAERCRQIETLRLKLDATAPFDETDLETLVGYHQDFQRSLAKTKKAAKSATDSESAPEAADEKGPPAVEPVRPPPVEPVKPPPVEPVRPPPVEPVKPPPVQPVKPPPVEPVKPPPVEPVRPPPVEPVKPPPVEPVKPPPVEPVTPPPDEPEPTEERVPGDAGVEGEPADDLETAAAEAEELAAEIPDRDGDEEGDAATEADEAAGAGGTADEPDARDVDSGVIKAAEAAAGDDLALEAVEAMAADDHAQVLRILHREVMSVAEHVLKGDVDQEFSVWQTLTVSGWYDIKKEALALAPVESFFSVAEEIRTRHRAGQSKDEIRAFIDRSEVTKLLLSLGETFKRQNL